MLLATPVLRLPEQVYPALGVMQHEGWKYPVVDCYRKLLERKQRYAIIYVKSCSSVTFLTFNFTLRWYGGPSGPNFSIWTPQSMKDTCPEIPRLGFLVACM